MNPYDKLWWTFLIHFKCWLLNPTNPYLCDAFTTYIMKVHESTLQFTVICYQSCAFQIQTCTYAKTVAIQCNRNNELLEVMTNYEFNLYK